MENKINFLSRIKTNFEVYEASLNGQKNSPIFGFQKASNDLFISNGIPTLRTEDWKYTNLSFLNKFDFKIKFTPNPETIELNDFKSIYSEENSNVLTFVDGFFSQELSLIKESDKIKLSSLKNSIIADSNFIDKFKDGFELNHFALNIVNSFSQDAIVLEISKGKLLEYPLIINHLNTKDDSDYLVNNKLYILANKDCNAKIITQYISNGDSNKIQNYSYEIFVDEKANLSQYIIQNDNLANYKFNVINANVQSGAVYSNYTICLNEKFTRNDVNISLNGEYSHADLIGLYLVNGKNFIDNHTKINHNVPNCTSNEIYKGVLDGDSVSVFNGKILVKKDAQKTNAYQSSKTILLSDTAKVNTKPELEIYADDVKCSHGASTGKLDEDALFYLKARGISEELARTMLLNAYAGDILSKIEIPVLRETLENQVSELLAK